MNKTIPKEITKYILYGVEFYFILDKIVVVLN